MQRVVLNIRSQPALVGLETKLARAPVYTRLAPVSIENEPSKLTIETHYPKVAIDSWPGWAELGSAGPEELSRRLRDQAWRDATFGTGRIAAEGDRLATFWEVGNTVEQIAAEDVPDPPFTLFALPVRPVLVEPSSGGVHIRYRAGKTAVCLGEKPDPRPYESGYARVYLRQQAAIEITWRRLDVSV